MIFKLTQYIRFFIALSSLSVTECLEVGLKTIITNRYRTVIRHCIPHNPQNSGV